MVHGYWLHNPQLSHVEKACHIVAPSFTLLQLHQEGSEQGGGGGVTKGCSSSPSKQLIVLQERLSHQKQRLGTMTSR